jgi:uncharacterized lipoprotein YmbA
MKTSVRAVWMTVGLLFCGCGSSPNTTYYTLAAVSGTIRQASLGTIEVRRPGIAGYLDRTEVLAQWDGQRLQLANNSAWGEPITAMIGRVLAEDLSDRLHGSVAISASSDLTVQASAVVELVIRKFDLGADGYVHLNVLWSLRGAGQTSTRASALQARPVTPTDTGAIVAAMSGVLGQLADEIANELLARGASAVSETPKTDVRE